MKVRLAEARDCARIAAIFAPYVRETAISFAGEPPGSEKFLERVGDTRFPFLVLEQDGIVTGYAYASPHRALAAYRWGCEVSIYMDRAAHRRGGGRRLYGALLSLLREQGYVHAYAGITLPNEASIGLHEKLGFRFFARFETVGWKLGAWHDVGWWDLPLQQVLPQPPAEPLAFATLREKESARVSRILAES